MRKILLFIAVIFSFCASGQSIQGGLIGGISTSQVFGDVSSGYNKVGLLGGVYANFPLAEKLRFQMEISFIQKGSRENPDETNGYRYYRLHINYIEVPFIARYIYSNRFDFEGGLAWSYLLNYKEESDFFIIEDNPFRKNNLNIIFGLYYKASEKWNVGVRASNSITAIRPHRSGQTWLFNRGQYNNVISFGLYYKI